MANKKKQFTKEFKQDAVNYHLDHPELSLAQAAKNLGIGESTLARWKGEMKRNPENSFRGSGNNSSDEAKEIARLKRELKDAQDALEILKKAISILGE